VLKTWLGLSWRFAVLNAVLRRLGGMAFAIMALAKFSVTFAETVDAASQIQKL
jgi:hypothetical protein